jgi:hypothetical protein
MPFYDDQESWLMAMIKGREKSQIGWKNPPLINSRLWGLLLVIGPNIQHCRVCFAAREYAAGDNDRRLDGAIVQIVEVFTADHPNSTMRRLFHHNRGYASAIVLSLAT